MYAGVGIKYLEILKMKIRCVEVEIVFGQNSLYPTVSTPINCTIRKHPGDGLYF